jgi:hypothetical protein
MALSHTKDQKPSVRVKELIKDSWKEISNNNLNEYRIEKQENIDIGTPLVYLNYDITPYRVDNTLRIVGGTGSGDFDLIHDAATRSATLQLKNPFDVSTQSTYTLSFQIEGKLSSTSPARVVSSFDVHIDVKTLEILSPTFSTVQNFIQTYSSSSSSTTTTPSTTPSSEFTLRDLIEAAHEKYNDLPLPSRDVLGPEINSVLDVYLSGLPLIGEGIDAIGAKRLIALSPYAVWFTSEDYSGKKIVRTFVKFQKGPVSVQIEFVVDEIKNGAYWLVNLGSSIRGAGFQPSTVHSSLSFMDHAEGGITYTSTNVTKSDFKCLPLPSDLQLAAGIHLIAKGNLIPGGYTPILNPRVDFRIGLTEAGWTVPDLVVNIALENKFIRDFDWIITRRIFELADAPGKALREARARIYEARRNVRRAEWIFEISKRPIQYFKDRIRDLKAPIDAARAAVRPAQDAVDAIKAQQRDLFDDEICTPNVYIPYFYPSWCGWHPCIKTGYTYFPVHCVPNLVSRVAAYALSPTRYALQGTLQAAQRTLDGLEGSLRHFESLLKGAEQALEEAKVSLEVARLALIGFEQALVSLESGYGELGKVAKYIVDRLGKVIETSKASFETKLSVASSGSLSGKLSFDFKFRGTPKRTLNVDFDFSDPVSSVKSIAESLVN